jgi:hypothetical protein
MIRSRSITSLTWKAHSGGVWCNIRKIGMMKSDTRSLSRDAYYSYPTFAEVHDAQYARPTTENIPSLRAVRTAKDEGTSSGS